MAQHDMIIDNGPGMAVRTDMNAALAALVSCSLGPIEPMVTYAGQLWLNSSIPPNGRLYQRDLADAAWIDPQMTVILPPGVVRVDLVQAFTQAERMQARANVNAQGNLFLRTFVVASAPTFLLNAETKLVQFELIAPGGAGGGVAGDPVGTSGTGAMGGGGGGGEYAFLGVTSPVVATPWNITIGAFGAPGAIGNFKGGDAGNVSITDGAVTVTAIGGKGGLGAVAQTASGGLGGVGGTGGVGGLAAARMAGANGDSGSHNVSRGGTSGGGDTGHGWGLGGLDPLLGHNNGVQGSGYGAGGSGASVGANSGRFSGGAGRPGVVVVTEYK